MLVLYSAAAGWLTMNGWGCIVLVCGCPRPLPCPVIFDGIYKKLEKEAQTADGELDVAKEDVQRLVELRDSAQV